jgi:hypothetical protein
LGSGFSVDRTLSLLRGSWQHHTYRQKWVLEFDSDTKMNIDFEAATYTIDSEEIRIELPDQNLSLRYTLGGDHLSITYPDGTWALFERENEGVQEERLDGPYFSASESTPGPFLTFNGGRYFSYRDWQSGQAEGDSEDPGAGERRSGVFTPDGVYRVEGEFIILAFYDGEVSEASVRRRDPDGNIVEIVFDGRYFGKDQLFFIPPIPPVVDEIPPVIFPVPPEPPMPPGPDRPLVPPSGGEALPEHSGHNDNGGRRFGNTRGDQSERQGSGSNASDRQRGEGQVTEARDFGTTRGPKSEPQTPAPAPHSTRPVSAKDASTGRTPGRGR